MVVCSECGVFLLGKMSSEQIVLFKVRGDNVALWVSVVGHRFGIVGTFAKRRSVAKCCFGMLPCSTMLVKVRVGLVLCREVFDVCGSVLSKFSREYALGQCEKVGEIEVSLMSLCECVGIEC